MISRDIFETGSGLQLVVDKTSENECTFTLTKCGVLLHTDTIEITPNSDRLDTIVMILGGLTGAGVDVDEDYFHSYSTEFEDWRVSDEAGRLTGIILQCTNFWGKGSKILDKYKKRGRNYFKQRTKFL